MNMNILGTLMMAGVATLLSGCVLHQEPKPNDPMYAPVMGSAPAQEPYNNGSLYRPKAGLNLFSDRVAASVGDILTIILEESTSSSKSTNVDISKESETLIPSVGGGAGTLLGSSVLSLNTNLASGTDFKGGGSSDQSNKLNGSVTVSIVDVWPNGTLVIRGEKWLTLNNGKEFIRVSGLVRPDDITPGNTVMSNKIANAQITYSGTGQMAESQKMGWLSRFFNGAYWPL